MNANPLISIVTPLYNAEAVFEGTFGSVIAQTFKDFEWVIVDDCSTDESFALAAKLIEGHPNIRLFQMPHNGGSAKARNKGLDEAKGKYVTFLDADDVLDPDYLEKQLAFIKDHGPIISSAYRRKTEQTCTTFTPPAETTYKSILKGNPLSCLSTMYNREVFPEDRFPEDLTRHEDFVFWARLLKKGYKAISNPEVLATYRLQSNSKNSDKKKLIKPMVQAYHKGLGINIITSWFFTARYVFYSLKKYKGVH
ncbi:MAG: glycosyltransferase family 2 protein [Bacilli bacterium]|nr:glycosyltransferase family 2 protein [Bacilli bacterium]